MKPDLAWLKKRGVVRVQKEQLAVPVVACVRLQPQNTEDESRGTMQTCTAKSYERSPRNGRGAVVKVSEFSCFQPNFASANNGEGQFVTFSRSGRRPFQSINVSILTTADAIPSLRTTKRINVTTKFTVVHVAVTSSIEVIV